MPQDQKSNRITFRNERVLGLLLGAAPAYMSWHFLDSNYRVSGKSAALISIAAILVLIACFAPARLSWLNRLWIAFGEALGRVVNPIVLTALFLLVFVPTGAALRLFRRDILRLRRAPSTESFWIDRQGGGPEPGTATRQF